ncbi:hypothetical protein GYMLUDRAFT_252649 [Collybiopsis luxurians FD-317 M1]|uniref:Uncharacterized protein n=1 Tax=Collybiopsis luxurians FD-317 M1 TaxID=944289 RepID=A0A0D0AKP2_9AGAR|nr:hypothetical protein GYMLUDRAFT_252649 [Collybiopsis luxurians FD-317 M1]
MLAWIQELLTGALVAGQQHLLISNWVFNADEFKYIKDKYNLLGTDFLEEPPIPFNGFTKEGEIIVFFTEDLTSLLDLKSQQWSPPEDKDSMYEDSGNEEEDKLGNELQEETCTEGSQHLKKQKVELKPPAPCITCAYTQAKKSKMDQTGKPSPAPSWKIKSREAPISCAPSMASIKTLDFVLPSKTKPAAKHADKEAASAKSMPPPSDTNPQADMSNKAPSSSLSTKGKMAKVPFTSAPSAKLAIPKKMAPSYHYEPVSVPRVPSAKVTSLLGGFLVNPLFTPKGIPFAKEPLKVMNSLATQFEVPSFKIEPQLLKTGIVASGSKCVLTMEDLQLVTAPLVKINNPNDHCVHCTSEGLECKITCFSGKCEPCKTKKIFCTKALTLDSSLTLMNSINWHIQFSKPVVQEQLATTYQTCLALDDAQAMLAQHTSMVDNLKMMYFAAVANLCSSIDKPISVLQQLRESMPGHQFTFNKFCFLATFCGWNSPFNFTSASTSSLTLSHWLKFVQQNSAFANLSTVVHEGSSTGPGTLEGSSTTSSKDVPVSNSNITALPTLMVKNP